MENLCWAYHQRGRKMYKLDGIMDTIIEPLIISIDAESNTSFGGSDTDTELALQWL